MNLILFVVLAVIPSISAAVTVDKVAEISLQPRESRKACFSEKSAVTLPLVEIGVDGGDTIFFSVPAAGSDGRMAESPDSRAVFAVFVDREGAFVAPKSLDRNVLSIDSCRYDVHCRAHVSADFELSRPIMEAVVPMSAAELRFDVLRGAATRDDPVSVVVSRKVEEVSMLPAAAFLAAAILALALFRPINR